MKFLLSTLFFVIVLSGNAQPGSLDLNFNSTDKGYSNCEGPNGSISATLTLANGKTLVGGGFTTFNGAAINNLIRLNPDGTKDLSFQIGSGVNGQVVAIKTLTNNQILIAGQFTTVNGVPANRIARLNEDGTLDPTFSTGTGFNGSVLDIALQTDNKIIVVGDFTTVNGISSVRMVRLNSDGSVDDTFNVGIGADGTVYSAIIQNDGKIVIGGFFQNFNGINKRTVARINTDGSVDNSFGVGVGANTVVYCVSFQSDGKILVSGQFTYFNTTVRNSITRLNANGSNDLTFNMSTGVDSQPVRLVRQLPDGRILLAGQFNTYNGVSRKGIAICDAVGNIDNTFNAQTDGIVYSVERLSNGAFVLGGSFNKIASVYKKNLAKMDSNCIIDPLFMFNYAANGAVYEMVKTTTDQFLVGGSFTMYNNVLAPRITRINLDGSVDSSFSLGGYGPDNTVQAICHQADGKILIGGYFNAVNSIPNVKIARLNSNGSLDPSFNTGLGFNNATTTIAVQPDGKILVGGYFTSYNGTNINRLVRLNNDGTIDNSFTIGTGFNNTVNSIVIQNDGKIIVGGDFTSYNSISPKNRIIRLNSDGTIDPGFNVVSGANYAVNKILIQPDGKILVAGNFTQIGGTTIGKVARLNSIGQVEQTFNDPFNGFGWINGVVNDIALQNNGQVVVVGDFEQFGTDNINIVRVNADGTYDLSFTSIPGPSDYIKTAEVGSNGKIYTGGPFTSWEGIGRNRIARLHSCMEFMTQTIAVCDSLVWIDGNTYYASTNAPSFIVEHGIGCDTLVSLHLTVLNSGIDVQTSCTSYTWMDGVTYYNSTNAPTWTLTNSMGCDSIVTLNLTINNSATGTDVQTSCGPFTWINGTTYNSSTNSPTHLLSTINGCDSLVTLNLTVINPSASTISANGCGSYTLNGQTYASSGTYVQYLQNTAGCDSTLTLNLTINESTSTSFIVNSCGPYFWEFTQQTYSISGIYQHTGSSIAGCDSTVTLSLFLGSIPTATVSHNGIGDLIAGPNLTVLAWIDCSTGNAIPGETSNIFSPVSNGTYAVVLQNDISGCSDTSDCITLNNVDIKEFDISDIDVYPNPTNNLVTISFEGNEAELTIYDAQGKLIQNRSTIHSGEQVSLANVQTGVYFFELSTHEGKVMRRVAKN